jgi:hypothetical protein
MTASKTPRRAQTAAGNVSIGAARLEELIEGGNDTRAYSEPTPISRFEVLELERAQDERRRKWQSDQARFSERRAIAGSVKPMT